MDRVNVMGLLPVSDKIVMCGMKLECGAYPFCLHASKHRERMNCYNGRRKERKCCPKCREVKTE